jgi:hypothetical protein
MPLWFTFGRHTPPCGMPAFVYLLYIPEHRYMQVYSQRTLQPSHSTRPCWISTILSQSARLTGPYASLCLGNTKSLPSNPILPTGATRTAVPTPNASISLPCVHHLARSCIVNGRSWGYRRMFTRLRGSNVDGCAAARARQVARVRPGKIVPSSGGVTKSRSSITLNNLHGVPNDYNSPPSSRFRTIKKFMAPASVTCSPSSQRHC